VEEGAAPFSEKMVWKMWKQSMLRRSWMDMVNGKTKSWFLNKFASPWTRHRGELDFPKLSFNAQWRKKQKKS
jgi:L-lactate dehydrogenase complex protein LldF